MRIKDYSQVLASKLAPKNGGRPGRSSLQTLQGAANPDESVNFATRKLLLGADIGFADRIRGAGQEGNRSGTARLFRARQGDRESTCAH
jgi:hypothetical protein